MSLAGKGGCSSLLCFAAPAIEHLDIDAQFAGYLGDRHFALLTHAHRLGLEFCVKVFPFHLTPPLGLQYTLFQVSIKSDQYHSASAALYQRDHYGVTCRL